MGDTSAGSEVLRCESKIKAVHIAGTVRSCSPFHGPYGGSWAGLGHPTAASARAAKVRRLGASGARGTPLARRSGPPSRRRRRRTGSVGAALDATASAPPGATQDAVQCARSTPSRSAQTPRPVRAAAPPTSRRPRRDRLRRAAGPSAGASPQALSNALQHLFPGLSACRIRVRFGQPPL